MKIEAYILKKTGVRKELILSKVELKAPQANEVQIRQNSIGVNFIDVYFRTGLYKTELPAVLGMEGMGEILQVGDEVKEYKVGDYVGYAFGSMGSYQKIRNVDSRVIFLISKSLIPMLSGTLLRGLTVEYLIRMADFLKKGDVILFHAMAGGVGLIALQWLKHLGIKIIATAGSEEKRKIVQEYGADLVLDYKDKKIVEKIREFTGGVGVKVVYDSIGKETFHHSLDSLCTRGLMVSYGNSSGAVDDFSPLLLSQKGSLFLTRPTLADYYSKPGDILKYATRYLELVEKGIIKNQLGKSFSFSNLNEAHEHLENRKSIGGTWLVV